MPFHMVCTALKIISRPEDHSGCFGGLHKGLLAQLVEHLTLNQ